MIPGYLQCELLVVLKENTKESHHSGLLKGDTPTLILVHSLPWTGSRPVSPCP